MELYMPRRSIALTILVLLAMASVIPSRVAAQQQSEPLYNVEPHAGSAGTRFAFMATGFLGYDRVGVWLNDPDGRAVVAHVEHLDPATGFGRVDWFWTAPDGIRPG